MDQQDHQQVLTRYQHHHRDHHKHQVKHGVKDLRPVQDKGFFAHQLEDVIKGLHQRRPHATLHTGRDLAVQPHDDPAQHRSQDQGQNTPDDRIVQPFNHIVHSIRSSVLTWPGKRRLRPR